MNSVTNHEIQFICVTVSFERLFHSGYDSQALPVDAGFFIYGEKISVFENVRIGVERAKMQTFCYGHKSLLSKIKIYTNWPSPHQRQKIVYF